MVPFQLFYLLQRRHAICGQVLFSHCFKPHNTPLRPDLKCLLHEVLDQMCCTFVLGSCNLGRQRGDRDVICGLRITPISIEISVETITITQEAGL